MMYSRAANSLVPWSAPFFGVSGATVYTTQFSGVAEFLASGAPNMVPSMEFLANGGRDWVPGAEFTAGSILGCVAGGEVLGGGTASLVDGAEWAASGAADVVGGLEWLAAVSLVASFGVPLEWLTASQGDLLAAAEFTGSGVLGGGAIPTYFVSNASRLLNRRGG